MVGRGAVHEIGGVGPISDPQADEDNFTITVNSVGGTGGQHCLVGRGAVHEIGGVGPISDPQLAGEGSHQPADDEQMLLRWRRVWGAAGAPGSPHYPGGWTRKGHGLTNASACRC